MTYGEMNSLSESENISVLPEKHLIVYLLTISPKKNCAMKSRNVIFKSDKIEF